MRKGLISVNYYIQLYLSLDLKIWYDWFHMLFSLSFFLAISIGSTTARIFSLLSFITHSRFDRFAKTLEKCTRQRLRPAKQPFFRKQICEFTLEEIYPFYIHLAHRIQTPIQKLRILIFEESNHNESFEIGCWIPWARYKLQHINHARIIVYLVLQ